MRSHSGLRAAATRHARHPSQVFLNTGRTGQARPAGAVPRLPPAAAGAPPVEPAGNVEPGRAPGRRLRRTALGSAGGAGSGGGRAAGTGGERPTSLAGWARPLRLLAHRRHVPFSPRGEPSSLRRGGSRRPTETERGPGGVSLYTLASGLGGASQLSPLCRAVVAAAPPLHLPPDGGAGGVSRQQARPGRRPPPRAVSLMLLFVSQEPQARPGPPPGAAAAGLGPGPAPGMSVCGEAVGAGSLPSELVVHIFSFLAAPDRLRASAACSHWRECLFYPALWPRLRLSLRVSPAERPRLEFLMRKCGWFVRELRVQFAADNYPTGGGGGGAAAAGEGAAVAGDGEAPPPLSPRWLDLLRTYLELVLCVLSSVRNNRYRRRCPPSRAGPGPAVPPVSAGGNNARAGAGRFVLGLRSEPLCVCVSL